MVAAHAAQSSNDDLLGTDLPTHAPPAMRVRMRLGCELRFYFPQPTPLIAMLNVHQSRAADLERPDTVMTSVPVPVHTYRDMFGNTCTRMTAPAGEFAIGTDSVIQLSSVPEPFDWSAAEHAPQDLPDDTLVYLLGSRYCDTDTIMSEAWRLFGHVPPGMPRVQAVCDFVHNHLAFNYQNARNTRTAFEAYNERTGVCRDFTHLAIALCRSLNIPARYCTGYISDLNQPPPYAAMDFCAWMSVYLGGRWHDFDPRNNRPMTGRVLCATGRDAADVPLTHTFGWGALNEFKVWIDEIKDPGLKAVV